MSNMEWKTPLTEPIIGQEEIDAVTKVLKSKWLTMGSVTNEFEKKFAKKMKVNHAIAVTNCTAALHLANLALGIAKDDEVICPALTFVASANATRYTGAKVIFADVFSEHELTISPDEIESNITAKTKAITVVHYAGFSCMMDEILEIAKKYDLKIIEDCAHAPFGIHQFNNGTEKFVGSIGDIGCFSFFGNKNMTTGEGGMITTNNDALAEKIRLLRSHGMTTLTYDRHKGHSSVYDVLELGYNYRIDEIHSAIGLCQLDKIDYINMKRREVYQWYIDEMNFNDNIIIPFHHKNLSHSTCHIMPVIVRENYHRIKQKLKNARVQTSKHYSLIPNFTSFESSSFHSKVEFINNILTLPLSPLMKRNDVELIHGIINEGF